MFERERGRERDKKKFFFFFVVNTIHDNNLALHQIR